MRKKNTEEKKLIKQVNDDTNVVKKFVFILLGVIVVSILLYVVTVKYLKVDDTTESTETTITYTNVNAGNVFNRPYDNYYVFAYDTKDGNANYYGNIVSQYQNESTNKKIYTMDLDLAINKKYVSDKSNKNATKTSELSLKNPTLIEIKKGKIVNYYDTEEAILNVLK